MPDQIEATVATFADDTAIMAVGEDAVESTEKLQRSINKVGDWTKRWRIKLNENKSVHVNFTNRARPLLCCRISHVGFFFFSWRLSR
ncbi:hypothetical protein ACUWC3_28565, partial [Klebsiella pneumoniae]|uniref:hypothetical protein n=1 Tax=Klebsiella pneumoniae TaxID=573 RepID=UPI00405574A9